MSSPSPIPDSPTESHQPADLLSPDSAKKKRRQTAFYPNTANKPQNPFSRSAAKRESVMTLGSIEHLQHYFTKTGFAASQNPLSSKSKNNLVPALGPGILKANSTQSSLGSDIILPPTPALPSPLRPAFQPHVKTYQIDPELLKPSVIEDLEAVEHAWCLKELPDPQTTSQQACSSTQAPVDVLSVLKTTTRTIRSVRNYIVSLRDDFTAPRQAQTEFRPSTLSPPTSTPRKAAQPARQVSSDPPALVRKSALEVLSVLRHLEEAARMPLTDDVYEVQSDSGSASTRSHTPGGTERVASPSTDDDESTASFSFSVVKIPPQKNEILVWSDEEDNNEEEEKKEHWDERLVLGGGWLYRQDMTMDQLSKERQVIRQYLHIVDALLFGGDGGQRGWKKEKERLAMDKSRGKGRRSLGDGEGRSLGSGGGRGRRIVSAGMLNVMRNMVVSEEPEGNENVVEETDEDRNEDSEASMEDDDLPNWAKRSKFVNEPLDRLMSLLITLLPAELMPLLPPPSDSSPSNILLRLSSGQILCTAYNIAVHRSKKPWGYINKDSIHDIATIEAQNEAVEETEQEKRKVGWTFRRTDNLRLWAAALRLRYMLNVGPTPIQSGRTSQSTTPVISPSPSQQAFILPPTTLVDDQFVRFDPQVVAKREEGWETMLESATLKWMWAVVAEKRHRTKS